jgi:hypothetical protein
MPGMHKTEIFTLSRGSFLPFKVKLSWRSYIDILFLRMTERHGGMVIGKLSWKHLLRLDKSILLLPRTNK